jgi:membrane fusion protein
LSDLFRKEAVNHAIRRLDGEVLLGASLSWKALGYGAAALVGLALIFASLATYARKETVTGWLVPRGGIIRISAREGGVLEQLSVHEGDIVRAGAPLARVRLSTDTSHGDSGAILERTAQSQIQAVDLNARAQVAKIDADKAQLRQQDAALKAQRDEAVRYVDLLSEKQALAQKNLDRAQELAGKGFLSKSNLEATKTALLSAQEDLSAARSKVLSIDQQRSQIASQIGASGILVAQAQTQAAADRASLDQKLEQISAGAEYTITAPIAGKVTALPIQAGQTVAAGTAVLMLTPNDSQLEAELFIPSRAAGFIRPGQDVSLQYQAFPYAKFGSAKGKVISVSKTVLAPGDVALPGLTVQEPVFRVRAALAKDFMAAYGARMPLQPGMLLNAAIIVERRSLLEWLLDPLYAVGRR